MYTQDMKEAGGIGETFPLTTQFSISVWTDTPSASLILVIAIFTISPETHTKTPQFSFVANRPLQLAASNQHQSSFRLFWACSRAHCQWHNKQSGKTYFHKKYQTVPLKWFYPSLIILKDSQNRTNLQTCFAFTAAKLGRFPDSATQTLLSLPKPECMMRLKTT